MSDGKVKSMDRLVQPILFEDMTFQGIGPTDIDIFMESNGTDFLFTEVKHISAKLDKNSGQIRALVSLVDAVIAGGANASLIFAQHDVEAPTAVYGTDCACICIYNHHGWVDLPSRPSLDIVHKKFLQNAGRLTK